MLRDPEHFSLKGLLMQHVIAYEGVHVSLGILQMEYGPIFMPWPNARIGIEGTLQRPPYVLSDWENFLTYLSKNKGRDEAFAVLRHKSEPNQKLDYEYIGHMSINDIRGLDNRAKTGSVLGAKDSQGKGYGTEAKLLLLYHAFYVLGLRKICSSVKINNPQSLASLLKTGHRVVGKHKAHVFHEGTFVDELILEVFREEWESIWKTYKETKEIPKLTDAQRQAVKELTVS